MNVTIKPRDGVVETFDARSIEITLSNGKLFDLRELGMFPGALNVTCQDDALIVYPRSSNSCNLRSE